MVSIKDEKVFGQELLPDIRARSGHGHYKWTLQQDDAPSLTAKAQCIKVCNICN